MAACLDDDTLAALADGLLDPDAMAGVDEHIDSCEACRGLIADLGRAAVDTVAETTPGARIGSYQIERILRAGSLRVVYAARDLDRDRPVALKLIAGDRDSRELLAEVGAIARLDHRNIVPVLDAQIHGDRLAVAAELDDAVSMVEWLKADPGPARIVAALTDAARGLAAAHEAGVIHGDFELEQVLVTRSGRVMVDDFGLARLAGASESIAPEQLAGGVADAATDQFAFGIALYQALTGRHPFVVWGKQVNVPALRAGRLERLDGVPRRLRRIIRRALSADPSRRFTTMTELVARLDAARQRRVLLFAIAGTVAGIAAGIALVRAASHESPGCDAVAARDAAQLWSATRRDRVRAVYEATGAASATRARILGATIDRAVQRWERASVEVCAALEREVPDPAALQRGSCLKRRALELRALFAVLETADPAALDAAARDAPWVTDPGCELADAGPSGS